MLGRIALLLLISNFVTFAYQCTLVLNPLTGKLECGGGSGAGSPGEDGEDGTDGIDGNAIRLIDTASSGSVYTVTNAQITAYDSDGTFAPGEIMVGALAIFVPQTINDSTTPTITINALDPKTIRSAENTALLVGELKLKAYLVWWDGTYWRLVRSLRRRSFSFEAATCQEGVAYTSLNFVTSISPTCPTLSNSIFGVLPFADSGSEVVAFSMKLPDEFLSFDLGLEVVVAATSSNSVYNRVYACQAAGDSYDPTYSSGSDLVIAANGTTNRPMFGSWSATIPTSCAGKMLYVKINRNSAHASDAIAGVSNIKSIFGSYLVE